MRIFIPLNIIACSWKPENRHIIFPRIPRELNDMCRICTFVTSGQPQAGKNKYLHSIMYLTQFETGG